MEIKFKKAKLDLENFAKVTIMEVPLVDNLIQDCYSYYSMDAPSELKLLILEQVSKAFDEYVLCNAPKNVDKDNLKKKLDKIDVKYKSEKSYIINISNQTIDFSKIERVGDIGGDPAWLRYSVYFTGGSSIEFYDERRYSDSFELIQMKREDFVKIWKDCS